MKILETDLGWALEHDGKVPIVIDGENYFPDRIALTESIEKRKMFVWADGSVMREPESGYGAPPTQDPPTDPGAQPDDPDPNPVSPEPVTTKPKKASGGRVSKAAAERVHAALETHKGDNIMRPEFIEAAGGKEAIKKLSTVAKKKPATTAEDPAKPRRGRPPKYTPEERERRRKEQARRYAAERSEEQKAAARERAKRWRENNPDKVKEVRQKSTERRQERYQTDPEYRQQFNEYQRTYKRTRRVESE